MNRRLRGLIYTVPGLVLGAAGAASCGGTVVSEGDPPPLYVPCGLTCPVDGVAQGNPGISGDPKVDGFFRSVVHLRSTAGVVSAGIRAELDAIARSVGARGGDDADLKARLREKLASSAPAGLRLTYEPPRCSVSTEAVLAAQAKCDPSVDPRTATVQCGGSSAVDPGASAACGPNATTSCTGVAAGGSCAGTCTGECRLDVARPCAGTCRGNCAGTCTQQDVQGRCAGSCDGTCTGSCRLAAPGSCAGSCNGECTSTSPTGTCDAKAQIRCEASANASVDCTGRCSGLVTPALSTAPCAAAAKADASVAATCASPSLDVSYQLAASVAADAVAAGQFQAWLAGFERHVAAILVYEARSKLLGSVATDLAAHGQLAIQSSIEDSLRLGDLRPIQVVGLGCALWDLPHAIQLVETAGQELVAIDASVVDVLGSVGVSH